ncbi:unnamed protein product [Ranitomeya imitator]|uniref:Condensin complex subunit 2 n=1 Tax=Ranitomeya imitator TaxID=111125 RepID=A0ABN9KT76_9NEOB|nr:unnamed protein product [Ranitomeya imitator]
MKTRRGRDRKKMGGHRPQRDRPWHLWNRTAGCSAQEIRTSEATTTTTAAVIFPLTVHVPIYFSFMPFLIGDAGKEPQNKKQRKRQHSVETIEQNLNNITRSATDRVDQVDPLFQKAATSFDECSTVGVFLTTLRCSDYRSELRFDDYLIPLSTIEEETLPAPDSVDTAELKSLLVACDEKRPLCPSLCKLRLMQLDGDLKDEAASTLTDKYKESNHAFDINAEVEDDGPEMDDFDADMCDGNEVVDLGQFPEHREACRSERKGAGASDLRSLHPLSYSPIGIFTFYRHCSAPAAPSSNIGAIRRVTTCWKLIGAAVIEGEDDGWSQITKIAEADIGTMCLQLSSCPGEYSYFSPRTMSMWAGPEHWRFRPKQKIESAGDNHRVKKAKKVFVLDFEEDIDFKVHFCKTKAATTLAKSTLENQNKKSTTLPATDFHYDPDNIAKLNLRPIDRIKKVAPRNPTSDQEDGIKEYDYNNPNDTTNFCPAMQGGRLFGEKLDQLISDSTGGKMPKKDGAVRPILDLKLLNKFVRVRDFRMESLRSVIASLEKGEFLASVDIQDAYLHIPIFPLHQRFLRFAVNNLHFQFTALPFGLASAPRVFTKVMSTVVSILHSRDVDLMASKVNAKVPSFVSRYRDPQAIAVDALDKVVLRPAPSFLPKVVSSFHINEDIVLPSFCPAPTHRVEKALHTLDLVRALRSVSLLAAEAYTHSPVSPNERLGEKDFTVDDDFDDDGTFMGPSDDFTVCNRTVENRLSLDGEHHLIAEPQKVNRIEINYAKTAKKMDMKHLKTSMWGLLTSDPQNDEPPSNNEAETAVVKDEKIFSNITSDLQKRLPTTMAQNLSVPLAFACLLHLANEKGAKTLQCAMCILSGFHSISNPDKPVNTMVKDWVVCSLFHHSACVSESRSSRRNDVSIGTSRLLCAASGRTSARNKASFPALTVSAGRKAEHSGDVTAVLCFTAGADSQCREADGGGCDRHQNVSM